jgi:hypothetical protein
MKFFKILIFLLTWDTPRPIPQKFEPCLQDYALLKEDHVIPLGMACSIINGKYAAPYRYRMEIWKNGTV